MASPRSQARIEARIVERVAYCCQFELNDPRASFVTITGCKVSPDLAVATLSYTVMGEESERSKVGHMLEHATGFIRKQLGRVLQTRRIPSLRWEYDASVELQFNMENAIQDAIARDRQINPAAHGDLGKQPAATPEPRSPEEPAAESEPLEDPERDD